MEGSMDLCDLGKQYDFDTYILMCVDNNVEM